MRQIPGKENFQRMNYLYQISHLMANESFPHNIASTFYTNLLVNISKKTVQKLDIPIKRSICKKCHSLLIVGTTCKVRIKKKRVIKTCLRCKTRKTFVTNKGEYLTWTQKPESLVELIQY